MNELVSIIVPVYNVENYIHKSIESIINQSYSNIEIILIDDGSTDQSGTICDEYQRCDKRIKVIHKKNGGQGSARNIGLDNCSGKYIYFHDSDDWLDEDCICSLLDLLERTDSDVSVCNYRFVDESGKLYGNFSEITGFHSYTGFEVLKYMWNDEIINIAPWGKLFSASMWKNFRFKECYCEDSATMYLLYSKDLKISYDGSPHVNYMLRKDSDVRIFSDKKLYMLKIYEDVVEYSKKNLPKDLQKAAISKQIAVNFHVLSQLPKGKYDDVRKRIAIIIKKNRKQVLFDSAARKKNRIACLLSYFGIGTVTIILKIAKSKNPSL